MTPTARRSSAVVRTVPAQDREGRAGARPPCLPTCRVRAKLPDLHLRRGGSTRGKTLDIIARVGEEYGLPVATHLTCVGHTADELRAYLTEANARGVHNVVALRGDPPQGDTEFRQTEGGFAYANELVAMIRSDFPEMGIAVGGYPEVHQEAPSREADLDNLKRKVDAGADVVITQLFYDNDDFFRFRDDCDARGIDAAIVPGLCP